MAGAVVQLKTGQGGGGSATTIATGSFVGDVTAGNFLYVVVSCDNSPTITLTQNSGTATLGTVTSHGSAAEAGLVNKTEHFTIPITGSGSLDLLATLNSSQSQRVIMAAEVTGVSAVDGTPDITANDNSPTDTHSITVTAQPAFGLMYLLNFQGAGTAYGTGWTGHTVVNLSSTIGEGLLQTVNITATGAVTGNFNNAGVDRCGTTMIVFTDNPPGAAITGTATAAITEADVVAGGETIIATLTGDTFVAASVDTPIQFVGGNTAGKLGATSGDTTIALNSGLTGGIAAAVSAGDLVIAAFATGSAADRTLAITDGTNPYTLIDSELYSNDTEDTNLRVAYKFMTGTPDTATTFGPTGNNADAGAMAVYVFRGVDSSTPLDVAAVPGTGTDTLLVVPPDITPTSAGAYVVIVGAGAHDGGVDTFGSSDLVDFMTVGGSDDTNDITLGVGHIDNWSSGATNAATWTCSQTDGTGYSWAAMTIALRPAPDTTPFNDARQAIIDGLDSAQSEGTGWNAEVRDNLAVTTVVRTSDTVVTITLSAQASYNISAQETITVTLPATALTGGNAIVATPTFTVDPTVGGGLDIPIAMYHYKRMMH